MTMANSAYGTIPFGVATTARDKTLSNYFEYNFSVQNSANAETGNSTSIAFSVSSNASTSIVNFTQYNFFAISNMSYEAKAFTEIISSVSDSMKHDEKLMVESIISDYNINVESNLSATDTAETIFTIDGFGLVTIYKVTYEQGGPGFKPGDLLLATRQDYDGTGTLVELYDIRAEVIHNVEEGTDEIQLLDGRKWFDFESNVDGIEFIRVGNKTDTNRQGMVVIEGVNGQYIDVLDGIDSFAKFDDPIPKARFGELDGLQGKIASFPNIHGYGLYGQNVYLEGEIKITGGATRTELDGMQSDIVSHNSSILSMSNAISNLNSTVAGLGDLAYEDLVEWAKLGSTIVSGGYIKTDLLDTQGIIVKTKADGDLGDLSSLDMVGLAQLDTTVIVGGYLKTSLIDVTTLFAQDITASGSMAVGSATGYGSGNGAWWGDDNGTYKWRVGNPSGLHIAYDGTNLLVYDKNGNPIIDNNTSSSIFTGDKFRVGDSSNYAEIDATGIPAFRLGSMTDNIMEIMNFAGYALFSSFKGFYFGENDSNTGFVVSPFLNLNISVYPLRLENHVEVNDGGVYRTIRYNYTGSGYPAASIGSDGDFYVDTTNNIPYVKLNGIWVELWIK